MKIEERQEQIIEEFEMFTEWMDKYEYLISLGKELPEMAADKKTDDRLIRGCQSNLWLDVEYREGKLYFGADSDAFISKGLIAMLIKVYSGQAPHDILSASLYFPEAIGLSSHLSPSRSNGLVAMIRQIMMFAAQFNNLDTLKVSQNSLPC